ncbi:MAG: polymer-forming cytoskeletal protein, partial [Alphaproteobacteria bacterium]
MGNLATEGDIQCDGSVDGDILSRSLTVGEQAVINGSIAGEIVRVAGVVNGEINARIVELTRTARVTGDIIHATLSIEAGAFIDGLCRHVDPKKSVEIGIAAAPT